MPLRCMLLKVQPPRSLHSFWWMYAWTTPFLLDEPQTLHTHTRLSLASHFSLWLHSHITFYITTGYMHAHNYGLDTLSSYTFFFLFHFSLQKSQLVSRFPDIDISPIRYAKDLYALGLSALCLGCSVRIHPILPCCACVRRSSPTLC